MSRYDYDSDDDSDTEKPQEPKKQEIDFIGPQDYEFERDNKELRAEQKTLQEKLDGLRAEADRIEAERSSVEAELKKVNAHISVKAQAHFKKKKKLYMLLDWEPQPPEYQMLFDENTWRAVQKSKSKPSGFGTTAV